MSLLLEPSLFSAAKMVLVIKKRIVVQSKFYVAVFQEAINTTVMSLQTMELLQQLSMKNVLFFRFDLL